MRFILAARFVLNEVLGMSVDEPEAMNERLRTYKDDAGVRDGMQAEIANKVDADRAKLMIALLDAASKDP